MGDGGTKEKLTHSTPTVLICSLTAEVPCEDGVVLSLASNWEAESRVGVLCIVVPALSAMMMSPKEAQIEKKSEL
jgi:hypothetical protein